MYLKEKWLFSFPLSLVLLLLSLLKFGTGQTLANAGHEVRKDCGADKDADGAQPVYGRKLVLKVHDGEDERGEFAQGHDQGDG